MEKVVEDVVEEIEVVKVEEVIREINSLKGIKARDPLPIHREARDELISRYNWCDEYGHPSSENNICNYCRRTLLSKVPEKGSVLDWLALEARTMEDYFRGMRELVEEEVARMDERKKKKDI